MAKCKICKKKLSLVVMTIGKCKCEGYFCQKHRLPSQHACTFDYKKSAKEQLMKDNPVVKADKLIRI